MSGSLPCAALRDLCISGDRPTRLKMVFRYIAVSCQIPEQFYYKLGNCSQVKHMLTCVLDPKPRSRSFCSSETKKSPKFHRPGWVPVIQRGMGVGNSGSTGELDTHRRRFTHDEENYDAQVAVAYLAQRETIRQKSFSL